MRIIYHNFIYHKIVILYKYLVDVPTSQLGREITVSVGVNGFSKGGWFHVFLV